MKKSAFIFIHLLVVLSSASCYGDDPDNIHFNNVVLEADANCGTTKVKQANDAFDAQDLRGLGVAIASNVVPGGWALEVSYGFIMGLGSDSDGIGEALEQMYNDLIRCMDSKLNAYRSRDLEDKWRGLMASFEDHLGLLVAGGSQDEVRELIKNLWKNDMNTAINEDFSKTISEQEYLTAEALLPITKLVAEVYWLTYTTYLGMLKRKIDSGDYHDSTALQQAIITYNYDVDLGREKLETLHSWSHNAINVINVMFAPTLIFDQYITSFPVFKWKIKWEKTDTAKSGDNCGPITNNICESCWKDRITAEFEAYIGDLTTDYVDLIDILLRNSYLIGDYGQISYYQVTPPGVWYHCTAGSTPNLETITTGIQDAILRCNGNSDCIGFSWSDKFQNAMLKLMSNCKDDGNGLGTGEYTSIWKDTSPLCYQQVLTAEYPLCPKIAPDVTLQWADGSETYFRAQCDSNPDCIGYVWDPITAYGSLRTVECISYGMKKESVFNFYAKCSKLDIEYLSQPVEYVQIKSLYNDKCLALNKHDETEVISQSCGTSDKKHWSYDSEAKTVKLKYNGECLNNIGSDTVNTKSCDGTAKQQWSYITQTKQLKSVYNDKCLYISDGNSKARDCVEEDHQQWIFTDNNVVTQIKSLQNGGGCLQTDFNYKYPLDPDYGLNFGNSYYYAVTTLGCNGNTREQWIYDLETKTIKSLKYKDQCLALKMSIETGIILTLVVWPCAISDNDFPLEQWLYNTQTKQLKSVYLYKCLGVSGRGEDCVEGASGQQWEFTNNNALSSTVNPFIFIGLIAICCLCSFIGVCIKLIGSNKQYDLRYKVVAMETADDCRQSEEDYI